MPDASTTRSMPGPASRMPRRDSEAGFGIYKSTDGGNTWTHLAANTSVPTGSRRRLRRVFGVPPGTFGVQTAPAYSGPAFDGRSISSIVIDPDNPSTMYVGSARGVRGVSSVYGGGAVSLAPVFRHTGSGSRRTAARTSRCLIIRTSA